MIQCSYRPSAEPYYEAERPGLSGVKNEISTFSEGPMDLMKQSGAVQADTISDSPDHSNQRKLR